MKMYLEEYVRQNIESKQERVPEISPVSTQAAFRNCFEEDPGLKELWGLYEDTPGGPYLKRIVRRVPDVPVRKFEI